MKRTDISPPDYSVSDRNELFQKAGEMRKWIISPVADELGWKLFVGIIGNNYHDRSARRLIQEPLKALRDEALVLGMPFVPELGSDKNSAKNSALIVINSIADWAASQAEKDSAPEPTEKPAKRKTRRSKDEPSGDALTIGAIQLLWRERGRDNPPKGKDIINASGVKNVSRFIRKHWGSQTRFENAWCRGDVMPRLAQLEYAPEHHRGYDDNQSSKGYRRAGRTPGSGDFSD